MSGGRATVGVKQGKVFGNQAGDISSVSPQGYALTNRFFIETKFYKSLEFESSLKGTGKLLEFWGVAKKEAMRYKRVPLLIAKQNRLPSLLCTDPLGSFFLNVRDKICVELPQQDMHILRLDDFLAEKCTSTRLFTHDHGKALADFYHHKMGATSRGIEFEFEFEEWICWWESKLGPLWQNLRGRTATQYVMARLADSGPYAAWNVKCITQSENSSERKLNGTAARGTKVGTNKLSEEQVLEIFYASGTLVSIGAAYGVSPDMIARIKKKRSWQYLLTDK